MLPELVTVPAAPLIRIPVPAVPIAPIDPFFKRNHAGSDKRRAVNCCRCRRLDRYRKEIR
jgi:hypothetical protein